MKKLKYSSILATGRHEPITKLSQFRKYSEYEMGFFLNGKTIGHARLERVSYVSSKRTTCLQTESMSLDKKYRRKGHGIHLYLAIISHARRVGAVRIYSSRNLNKHSRRMWSTKLKKFFDVREVVLRKPCHECGSKERRVVGYYIQLRKS